MTDNDCDVIVALLQNSLNPETVEHATQSLGHLSSTNLPYFLNILTVIAQNPVHNAIIREQALVLLFKGVKDVEIGVLGVDFFNQLKDALVSFITCPDSHLSLAGSNAYGLVIGKLVNAQLGADLLEQLFAIMSNASDIPIPYHSLVALEQCLNIAVLEQSQTVLCVSELTKYLSQLELVPKIIDIFSIIAPDIIDAFAQTENQGQFLAMLMTLSSTEQTMTCCAKCWIELIETSVVFVKPVLPQLFELTTQILSSSTDETTLCQYCMILQSIAAYPDQQIITPQSYALLFQPLLRVLSLIPDLNNLDDPDQWTPHIAAMCTLDVFSRRVSDFSAQPLFAFVEANIADANPVHREMALICLRILLRLQNIPDMSQIATVTAPSLADGSIRIRYQAILTVKQLCARAKSENLQDPFLNAFIPMILPLSEDHPYIVATMVTAFRKLCQLPDFALQEGIATVINFLNYPHPLVIDAAFYTLLKMVKLIENVNEAKQWIDPFLQLLERSVQNGPFDAYHDEVVLILVNLFRTASLDAIEFIPRYQGLLQQDVTPVALMAMADNVCRFHVELAEQIGPIIQTAFSILTGDEIDGKYEYCFVTITSIIQLEESQSFHQQTLETLLAIASQQADAIFLCCDCACLIFDYHPDIVPAYLPHLTTLLERAYRECDYKEPKNLDICLQICKLILPHGFNSLEIIYALLEQAATQDCQADTIFECTTIILLLGESNIPIPAEIGNLIIEKFNNLSSDEEDDNA